MKNILLLSLLTAISALSLTSCYYDSEEDLYSGISTCDTTNITFSQTVQPILSQHCNICHNTTINNGGVITDNYNDLINPVNSGIFWKAINHEPGAIPMPFNGQKLSDCDLSKIKVWINQGAPNN